MASRILVGVFFLGLSVSEVSCVHATTQCVQVGQANYNAFSGDLQVTTYSAPYRHGFYTIGAEKFDTKYSFLDASWGPSGRGSATDPNKSPIDFDNNTQNCPYEYYGNPRVDLCPGDDLVEIRMYAVKQDGVVMQGWLHFEIELTDKTDHIMAIYVQIRDEVFNAIGEFITMKDEQCPSGSHPELIRPSAYQILPCSAVGLREAKLSNALFMVRKDFLRDETAGAKYLPKEELKRGIHFTWRLNEYWCNRHLRFRPEPIIYTRRMMEQNTYNIKIFNPPAASIPYRKAAGYWVFPEWHRSSDIRLPATTLKCDELAINYKNGLMMETKSPDGIPTLVASWLQNKTTKSQLKNDYMDFKQQYFDKENGIWSLKSCLANTRIPYKQILNIINAKDKVPEKPPITNVSVPTFSGRCKTHFAKAVSHDYLQGCNTDQSSDEFKRVPKDIEIYAEYLGNLTVNRTRQCEKPCHPPRNVTHLQEILSFKDKSKKAGINQKVVNDYLETRKHSRADTFLHGRRYHGELCIIWSFFLTPVGMFAARYYKETSMGITCLGIHVWLWVHLATLFLGAAFFGSSVFAVLDTVTLYGRSLNETAYAHRLLGYSSVFLFLLMILLGGIRPFSYKVRMVLLFLHSFLGFTQHLLNMVCIMLSSWIPASPSIAGCNEKGDAIGTPTLVILTCVWIFIDIVFHAVMTVYQKMIDRRVQITRRGCMCHIIPLLSSESKNDLVGGEIRRILFLVYVGVAGILCIVTLSLLSANASGLSRHCKNSIGPTSCEDNVVSVFGCSRFARQYAKRWTHFKNAFNVTTQDNVSTEDYSSVTGY